MNASDIIKSKQNRVLYQDYYRPTIFPGLQNTDSTLITTSVVLYPVSTVSTSATAPDYISSFVSCTTTNYLYKCQPSVISYALLNNINQGKYECGYPYCSSIVEWNTHAAYTSGTCNCKISFLTWKNTTTQNVFQYNPTSYSSVTITSTLIPSGPSPIVFPLVNYYQGTSFDNKCSNCSNNCC